MYGVTIITNKHTYMENTTQSALLIGMHNQKCLENNSIFFLSGPC
jgi:hypothetical protein